MTASGTASPAGGWRAALPRLLRALLRVDDTGRAATAIAPAELRRLAHRAGAGDAAAQARLGWAYLDGRGVPADAAEGVRWLRSAAAAGHARARSSLAAALLAGAPAAASDRLHGRPGGGQPDPPGTDPPGNDPREAETLARAAAEDGIAEAQALLGYMLATGSGGAAADAADAARWYRRALNNPDGGEAAPRAALGLGLLCLAGHGDAAEGGALLRRAAAAGLPTALYALGMVRAHGADGAPPDRAEAAALYARAAAAGHVSAQARLGLALLEGDGAEVDPSGGETWLRRAALAGDAEAAALVGDLHARAGENGPPNFFEAALWYRRAAENGHRAAQRALGLLHLTGNGVPRDPEEAVRCFAMAAARGDQTARADLGAVLLATRSGTAGNRDAEDPEEADAPLPEAAAEAMGRQLVAWLEDAASRGDLVAAHNLAVCRAHGVGAGAPDLFDAARWLRRAAEGVVNAQYWYARLLSDGHAELEDLPAAREWFARAHDAGFVPAGAALAEMLLNGRGGAADPAGALALFERAAAAGDAGAMFGAGALLAGGNGLMPDRAAAAAWFRRAAEAGHPRAQMMLGRFLARGHTPARHADEARHWLDRAHRAGVPEAAALLAGLAPRMAADASAD